MQAENSSWTRGQGWESRGKGKLFLLSESNLQCSWGNELVILDIKQSFLNWVSRIRNGIQFRRLEVKSKRNILERCCVYIVNVQVFIWKIVLYCKETILCACIEFLPGVLTFFVSMWASSWRTVCLMLACGVSVGVVLVALIGVGWPTLKVDYTSPSVRPWTVSGG